MAQLFVPGAVGVWASVGGTPQFFGTSERGVSIEWRPRWSDVHNDLAGEVPFDKLFQGAEAMITADFTRYNEPIYAQMQSYGNVTLSRGTFFFGEIGSAMLTEGLAYSLTLVFPYGALKSAYAPLGPGVRFLATSLQSDSDPQLGTRERKLHLSWWALPRYDVATGNLVLADQVMAGTTNIPPN